jgi:lambda family phage tail tape measure protein
VAIEATRKREGELSAEIEKEYNARVKQIRELQKLAATGKVGSDELREGEILAEQVFQDKREKIITKSEQHIQGVLDGFRKKKEAEEEKTRQKRIAEIVAQAEKESAAYDRAAERAMEIMARLQEEQRYASERVPRPWDVPGEKDRQKAEHDLNERANMLEAYRRKGVMGGGISEEDFGILSEQNVKTYKARLAQIEDATNQSTARIANLWTDLASGMEQDFTGLFVDVFEQKLKSTSDYFQAFANTLELVWSRFMSNMVVDWIQAQARMSAAGGFSSFLGSLFGGAEAAGAAGSVGSGVYMTAKGDVFDSPHVFRFSKGIGMLGEAGPEGVLPLKRTASGDLGVQVAGKSGGGVERVSVQIINETGQAVRVRDSKAQFNGQEMIVTAWLDGYTRDLFGMRTALGR